jgi:Mg/Co/Ni transporter MgtE
MRLTWKQTMPVWWSFFWRALLYGMLLGATFGFLAGFYAAFSGVPDKGALYGAIGGWVAAIPGSMLAIKQSVSRHLPGLTTASAGAS